MTPTIATETTVRQARRDDRWAARHVLWKLSRVARRRECGFKVRDAAGVAVKVTNSAQGRQAGYAGLSSCASVWCCPVCSAKIANVRQMEIQVALMEWVRRGGRVVLGTVTMRHYKHHSLTALWDGLTAARHSMLSGGTWKAEQSAFGIPMERVVKSGRHKGETVTAVRVPVISVVEVTHGVHGWHVHLHMLLLVRGDVSAADVATMGAGLFERWSASLVAAGFVAPSRRRGQKFDLLKGDPGKALGDYFTKSVYLPPDEVDVRAASMELARGDFKDAHHGNRTPFGILRGLVEVVTSGDLGGRSAEAVAIDEGVWHDWEAGSAGRRQIAWSVGLREWLKVVPVVEATAEEIMDEDEGGDEVHTMTAMTWAAVRRARGGARLLSAYEKSEHQGGLMLARFEAAGFRHEAEREKRATSQGQTYAQWWASAR
jgi:hypothetical protein